MFKAKRTNGKNLIQKSILFGLQQKSGVRSSKAATNWNENACSINTSI